MAYGVDGGKGKRGQAMKRICAIGWLVLAAGVSFVCAATNYNDVADGNYTAPATWGTPTYPSAPGDTAVIDSQLVIMNQLNFYDTYVRPGGTLRYDTINNANAGTIHMQGGAFDAWAGNNLNYSCTMAVESNSFWFAGNGSVNGNKMSGQQVMTGTNMLVVSNRPCPSANYTFGPIASSSTWTGPLGVAPGANITVQDWFQVQGGGSNSIVLQTAGASVGNLNLNWTPVGWGGSCLYTNRISGRGQVTLNGASGNPFKLLLTNSATVLPGTAGVAGTIQFIAAVNNSQYVTFEKTAKPVINIVDSTTNDLVAMKTGSLVVHAGAYLQINLFSPVSSGTITNRAIMTADNGITTPGNFAVTYANTNEWSGLVVYPSSDSKTLYFAGTYAHNSGSGFPPGVNNASGATNTLSTSAWLNGNVTSTGSSPASVWVFWDTTDRTTNLNWAYSHPFGSQTAAPPIPLTYQATGLASNTTYWYAYYASNTAGGAWDVTGSKSFKTYGLPAVNDANGASATGQVTATLNGNLTSGAGASITIYYGADTNNWAFTNSSIGTVAEGGFALLVTGLTPGTTYWYRCFASNAYGTAWAGAATSFSTLPAFVYRDAANGNWNNPNTWYSTNGGTNYPSGVDTAIITNYTISDNGTINGTVYLNATGTLRATYNPNCALGALHLNGGLLDMNGGAWLAAAPYDVYVDVDSMITNASLTGGGSLNPVNLHGSNALTFAGNSNLNFSLTTTTNSAFSGSYRILPWTTLSLGTPDTNGPAGWQYNPIYLVASNSILSFGQNNSVTYCGTLTGNGTFRSGFQGYGDAFGILGSGGMIAPGRPGTDDAATIRFFFDQFTFASNSTYAVNVASNGADLFDGYTGLPYKMPVIIDPNANLNVKLWTPRTNWTLGAGATIMLASNSVTTTGISGNFKVTWQNSNHWANLQVNYDTNSSVNRIYITGAYTAPPPLGTVFFLR